MKDEITRGALLLLQGVHDSLPRGMARESIAHVLEQVRRSQGYVEWFVAEVVFARLVLDHAYTFDDARAVLDAIRAVER